MSYVLTLVTSLLCFLSTYCQGSSAEDVIPFKLGDSVSTFSKLIRCNELEWNGTEFAQIERPGCNQFKFLPAEVEPVSVGTVKFPEVSLIADNYGKIQMVMFLKLYRKTGSITPKKLYTRERELMTMFMNSFSKTEPIAIKNTTRKEDTYVQEALTW